MLVPEKKRKELVLLLYNNAELASCTSNRYGRWLVFEEEIVRRDSISDIDRTSVQYCITFLLRGQTDGSKKNCNKKKDGSHVR